MKGNIHVSVIVIKKEIDGIYTRNLIIKGKTMTQQITFKEDNRSNKSSLMYYLLLSIQTKSIFQIQILILFAYTILLD